MPLSQLHYYFGSKQGLLLSLLEEENRRRLDRQTRMYASDRPLWERYEQACDFLEDDLDSGFVRVLQEMIAEGWANEAIGDAVKALLGSWYDLLTEVATEAEERLGPLGPFTAREVATLIGIRRKLSGELARQRGREGADAESTLAAESEDAESTLKSNFII